MTKRKAPVEEPEEMSEAQQDIQDRIQKVLDEQPGAGRKKAEE